MHFHKDKRKQLKHCYDQGAKTLLYHDQTLDLVFHMLPKDGRLNARGVTPIDWDMGCAIFEGTFSAGK